MTLWRVSRNGVDGTTSVSSGISGTSTPYPSLIIGTSAVSPSGRLWGPRIINIISLSLSLTVLHDPQAYS